MQKSDYHRFGQLLAAMAASFRVDAGAALAEGYWLGLRDLPFERVQEAITRAMTSSKRMPVPAELRELCGELTPAVRAVQAWGKAIEAIRKHSVYRSVDFEDKVINATIRQLGGWERFCLNDSDELHKWVKRDFERTYEALAVSGLGADQGRYLAGIIERENGARGFTTEAPRRVLCAWVRGKQQQLTGETTTNGDRRGNENEGNRRGAESRPVENGHDAAHAGGRGAVENAALPAADPNERPRA